MVGAGAVRHLEPRQAIRRPLVGRRLGARRTEFHGARHGHVTHARHRIDHDAQAIPTGQVVAPCGRLGTPHVGQEVAVAGGRQRSGGLVGKCLRLRHGPGRQQTCMDHRPAAFDMEQRLRPQPGQQVVTIRRGEDVFERVFLVRLAVAFGLHHQMQVVIAEHHARRGSQRLDEAQHLERRRPAIDQVADEPGAVHGRIETDIVEKTAQRVVTALQVADCVGGHDQSPARNFLGSADSRTKLSGSTITGLASGKRFMNASSPFPDFFLPDLTSSAWSLP